MKKLALFFTLGIIYMLILSGCKSSAAEAPASVEGTEEEAEKEVLTLMLNVLTSDSYVKNYQQIIDRFNQENEYGVIIEADFISNSEYKSKLASMMVTDSQPDIIDTWELGYLENFVNAGKVVNLQKYLEEDPAWYKSFSPGTLEQLTYNGDVYGIPTARCMTVMYYNKEIFEAYDLEVPTTYEEYCNICDTLLANGITPAAMPASADDGWLVSEYIQQLSNGIAGYELYQGIKDGSRGWNDPAMVEAAALFQEEVKKGYYGNNITEIKGTEIRDVFWTGKAAMHFNGSWEASNLDNAEVCELAGSFGCFVMPPVNPQYANISVGSLDRSFAVTSNCKNVEAAVAFVKFWMSEENSSMLLYESGRIPATPLEADDSKLSPLCKELLACFDAQKELTPWFDRMNTEYGNLFNTSCLSVAAGESPKLLLDALQKQAVTEQ